MCVSDHVFHRQISRETSAGPARRTWVYARVAKPLNPLHLPLDLLTIAAVKDRGEHGSSTLFEEHGALSGSRSDRQALICGGNGSGNGSGNGAFLAVVAVPRINQLRLQRPKPVEKLVGMLLAHLGRGEGSKA